MSKKTSLPAEMPEITAIDVPFLKNDLLKTVLKIVNSDVELLTLWKITNVTATKRLHMTDHGILHFNIVANNSLRLLRLFVARDIKPAICRDYKLTVDHAEVVVFLASLMHDLGMSIHRDNHEEYSLLLTDRILHRILDFLPISEQTIVISEVLHCIISHRSDSDGKALTVEAGILRVADALDMSEGRTRMPYDENALDIHSVSALAIDEVVIQAGQKTPVQVNISMNHTAGIFQVDHLLKKKVTGSGIEKYLEIRIYIDKGRGRQLFKDFLAK